MTMMDRLRGLKSENLESGQTVLATLDAADLRKFKEQRKMIADQARLLAMLQVCYNSFLASLQAKYGVPEAIFVNVQTGEVHKAEVEKSNG